MASLEGGGHFVGQSLREEVGIYMNSRKQTHKQGTRRQERGLSSLCGALVLMRVNICE